MEVKNQTDTEKQKQKEFDFYWIDDHSGQIQSIVNNVFPKLWERGVSQYIIQFDALGQEQKPEEYEETLNNMRRLLSVKFRDVCRDIADSEWKDEKEVFEDKKPLVNYKDSFANIVSILPDCSGENNDEKNQIIDLIHNWSDEKKLKELSETKKPLTPEVLAEKNMGIDALVNAFNIPNGKVVALDLCLIEHDDDRILDGNSPCLSMAIYDALKKRQCKIFPYTVFSYRNGLINNWQSKYSRFFCDEADQDEIKIYLIPTLTDKSSNSDYVEELCKIAKKEVNKNDK